MIPQERDIKLDLLIKKQFELTQRAREKGNRYAELQFFESAMQAAVKLNNYGRHLRKE